MDWIQSPAVTTLMGVMIGFALSFVQSWATARRSTKSSLLQCCAELDDCSEIVRAYAEANGVGFEFRLPPRRAFELFAAHLATAPARLVDLTLALYRGLDMLERKREQGSTVPPLEAHDWVTECRVVADIRSWCRGRMSVGKFQARWRPTSIFAARQSDQSGSAH